MGYGGGMGGMGMFPGPMGIPGPVSLLVLLTIYSLELLLKFIGYGTFYAWFTSRSCWFRWTHWSCMFFPKINFDGRR